MEAPKVVTASGAEHARIMSAAMLAFAADPMIRWFFPGSMNYLSTGPAFDAFCGSAIDRGEAYRTENCEGVALWHSPGFGPDVEAFVDCLVRLGDNGYLDDVMRVLEMMDEHHPDETCWYLAVLGVDTAHQGRGLGAALLKHSLRKVDELGLPAYLESSNPRNIALYERHGFEVTGQIQAGASPVMTPMYRAPRSEGR